MSWRPRNFLALVIASMACWLERQAAAQIEYLKAENCALRKRLGRRRILFTGAERRTLGALAKKSEERRCEILIQSFRQRLCCAGIGNWWHRNGLSWSDGSWQGLMTHYGLFVIELATRRVALCGITTNPNEAWMLQVAKNQMDSESGALHGKGHLIVDRDTKYSSAFRAFLVREGVEVIRLPPRSPNLNAYSERFVRSIKSECVSKLIPIGATMLRRALREYMNHYHLERNHQGLDNKLIIPTPIRSSNVERIDCRSRLGGMLRFYERAAA